MNCCYCERSLACDLCQRPYEPTDAESYRNLYEREYPVVCRACEKILRCRACGAIYSGSDEEYADEPRE